MEKVRYGDNGPFIDSLPKPFDIVIPMTTAQAELWFRTFDEVGDFKEAWDSKFSQNYWFDVALTAKEQQTMNEPTQQFLLQEFDQLREELLKCVKETRLLERNALLISGAIQAWAITNKTQSVYPVLLLVPPLIIFLSALRAWSLWKHIGFIAAYIVLPIENYTFGYLVNRKFMIYNDQLQFNHELCYRS